MSKNLHTRYSEYNRKRFKVFQEICEAGFEFLKKSTAAEQEAAAAAEQVVAPTVDVSRYTTWSTLLLEIFPIQYFVILSFFNIQWVSE